MKRIFLIGSLAIAVGFAVVNMSVTKQDVEMSLLLENVSALTDESGAIHLERCFLNVTPRTYTGVYVQKCDVSTAYLIIYPCSNATLIQTSEHYYSDPRNCYN
jgi:hypothetical protein